MAQRIAQFRNFKISSPAPGVGAPMQVVKFCNSEIELAGAPKGAPAYNAAATIG
ncbi:MAG TPA: hypothetical protein VMF13_18205 [Luteitalea sp.]|nr:hypothetical protein [Luteitalea sp.]